MIKCETCEFQYLYTLGADECGAGNIDGYCGKGHWHGIGPIDENDDGTYWNNCKDYKIREKNDETRTDSKAHMV